MGFLGGRIGLGEILIVLAVVLVVFGPRKLPEIGRSLGRGIKEFKKGAQDFSAQLRESVDIDTDPDEEGNKRR